MGGLWGLGGGEERCYGDERAKRRRWCCVMQDGAGRGGAERCGMCYQLGTASAAT